jgi:hypothetical protein
VAPIGSSCCISSGTLTMSAPALSVSAGACWLRPSPYAEGAGLASARGLADGCSEAGLLLCATGGAGDERANRTGAPVRASAAWDSECGLSDRNGVICNSAGGACSLCVWLALHPPGCRGRRVRSRVPRPGLCWLPWRWPCCRWAPGWARDDSRQCFFKKKNKKKQKKTLSFFLNFIYFNFKFFLTKYLGVKIS